MAIASDFLQSLVPISQFNKGQAAKIFDRLRSEKELIVLKNNQPSAIILSPEEYTRLTEIEEDYFLYNFHYYLLFLFHVHRTIHGICICIRSILIFHSRISIGRFTFSCPVTQICIYLFYQITSGETHDLFKKSPVPWHGRIRI